MSDANDLIKQEGSTGEAKPAKVPAFPVKEIDFQIRPESRLFGHLEGEAIGTEQYRLLHARLLHLQTCAPLKRILITSAGRGEGKTHVATNLALTIARETDRKVLLVDADIRKPDVHNVYGIPNDFGLTDVLRNGHDAWKAARKVIGMNVYILTAGSAISQPLTTASVLTFKALLDQVNPVFDWVIIDSPPVLLAADVSLLSKMVDGILLVVRGHKTPREMVERAKQMLGGNLVGVVLNGVSPLKPKYNSYYGTSPAKSGKRS